MIYLTGYLSAILNDRWFVDTSEDILNYRKNGNPASIEYIDIHDVQLEKGTVWDTVNISTLTDKISIDSLPDDKPQKLLIDIQQKIKNTLAKNVISKQESFEKISLQLDGLLKQDKYISQTDVRKLLSSVNDVPVALAHPYFDPSLLSERLEKSIRLYIDIVKPESENVKRRNDDFIIRNIEKYNDLFNKLEKYPLTEEQKKFSVINEDRNLLIAAAGSGKSSTIIAKAIYLIESGLATAEEILVLAYNKDAQLDVDVRLSKLLGKIPGYTQAVKAKTFHGLGMDILVSVDGIKPSISEMASASKTRLNILLQDLIKNLISDDSSFAEQWLSFLTVCKSPSPDFDSIKTYREYNSYLKELGAQWKGERGSQKLILNTVGGNEVKSMEEVRIANWLTINGVNFEYESSYKKMTADQSHRQYYPDFYYPDVDLYHEHFALNKNGDAPAFMSDYKEGVVWKRNLHLENETILIETHSAHFKDGSVFEVLKSELLKHGVTFNPMSLDEIDELICDAFNPENDLQIFTTFLRHFKANNTSIESIRAKADLLPDKTRAEMFLNVFNKIYTAYELELKVNNEIDFEDQINKACLYLESKQYKHSYKYILVDEFQDISQDRKRMIHGLIDQDDNIKLFAVGDDWQSIYRFSGADIDIMTNFSKHFGSTSENKLTKTFRSYQGIVDVAAEFIQRNPQQLKKDVVAIDDTDSDQVFVYEYNSASEQNVLIENLMVKIHKIAVERKQLLSVYLLGRYNKLKPKGMLNYSKIFPHLTIEFKTIHAAKGLEADYVFILNVESGSYGFPSSISDDPLLHMVIPQPETFLYSEERRLMYVALTRAKRAVFLFSQKSKQSPFITELAEIPRVKAAQHMKRGNPCPECDTGNLSVRNGKYGVFMGCSNYPDCKYTNPVKCPTCDLGKLIKKKSRNGDFLSCNRFPKCKYSQSI